MSRLIVHTGTDTILDAAECVVVDTDLLDDHDMARLSGDDYFDDSVIVEIAERCGVSVPSVADSARWNAFAGSSDWADKCKRVACASCQCAGASPVRFVDPFTARVVPWDVMGDSRSFVFVCDECAIGSAVVL